MFKIRGVTLEDLDHIYPLAKGLATSFNVEKESFSKLFQKMLTDENILVLVAETDELVGYIMGYVHPAFYANGLIAWVEELYVSPSIRGTGIGKALMESFEAEVQLRGCKLISLSTRRAGDFYEALNYEKSATYYKKTFKRIGKTAG
ncbi:MAG: GNAT family N-acetyltransferase [Mariprofundaceae bacterium]|nr:GNAT family N-acetyltransferase [Mariprofundaceae bacterium]